MSNQIDKVKQLAQMINQSDNIVFFGGAGVSKASGIPDFRSEDGLYSKDCEGKNPEYLLSRTCFIKEKELFFKFYREKMDFRGIVPNITHKYLAKLEATGKLKCVITQNIDNLHQKAGSKKVYELHGTINNNYCLRCYKKFDSNYVFDNEEIPKCDCCGAFVKPEVVLYEEPLDYIILNCAYEDLQEADLVIVAGTSLQVHPACDMVFRYKGKLVIINNEPTALDHKAALVIREPVENIIEKLNKIVEDKEK